MNELKIFNFDMFPVRTIKDSAGEPWFVAKDVCDAIGISNNRDAIERLDEDEKGVALTDTLGGEQKMQTVSESGLFTLILRCRDAVIPGSIPHKFRKWITSEVLPAIRKTGGYISAPAGMSDDEIMARALQVAQATIERNAAKLQEANRTISELAPAAKYTADVLAAQNLHTVNSVAVHLGISAIRLNRFLEDEGWIYRQGGIVYPASSIREKGYCDFHIVPYSCDENENIKTREHLKWTENGRKAIIELWNKRKAA